MKLYSLLAIPFAFVAGIVAVVLLQKADLVQIGSTQDTSIVAGEVSSSSTELQPQSSSDEAKESGNLLLSSRIDTLQKQLQDSTRSADRMQLRIDELEEKIDDALVGSAFLPTGEPTGGQIGEQVENLAQGEAQNRRDRQGRGFGGLSTDEQYDSLVAAGVDPLVATEIKRQSDQWTLQRLELVDQATREGWRRSDEFGERMQALRETQPDIRAELGEESYDRYLYESGDFNRVEVASIIDGSAAQLAGMQNGDVVLSYANSRVYSMRELQRSTSSGSRGESVQVQVLRNGQIINVDLPRGPLGVTLSGSRAEPE